MTKARLFALVGAAVVGLGLVVSAPPASAGGWAMSSLDPMSVPAADEAVQVGFTIRQHGVTPVNPDDQGDAPVAIAVRSASGRASVFPAAQEGATGHYVAEVIFPEAGEASWEILQGWFGPHDLGMIDVAAASSGGAVQASAAGTGDPDATSGADHRWPLAARVGALSVAVAATCVALADTRRGRRPVEALPP